MHIFIIILQLHGILFTIGKNVEGFLENFALETKIIDDVLKKTWKTIHGNTKVQSTEHFTNNHKQCQNDSVFTVNFVNIQLFLYWPAMWGIWVLLKLNAKLEWRLGQKQILSASRRSRKKFHPDEQETYL